MSTLAAIEAAVFALLAPLTAAASPTPGPFRYLGRWLGAITQNRDGSVTVDKEVAARSPALLLWVGDEQAADDIALLVGDAETRGAFTLKCAIVLREVRGSNLAVTGTTMEPGLLPLCDAVTAVLSNVFVADSAGVSLLLRDTRLHYRGQTTITADANVAVVVALSFEAERNVEGPAATEPGAVPYLGTTGSIHLLGQVTTPSNADPLVEFKDH